jgi:ribosomal protein L12E/L44/L45/RPP1/RPP2
MQESPQLANAPGEAQLTWLINSTEKKKKKKERKKERKEEEEEEERKKKNPKLRDVNIIL